MTIQIDIADDAVVAAQASSPLPSLNGFVGMQMRERRKRLGMTIAEMAQATGLSTSNLSKIEIGTVSPSLQSLAAIAQAISVPVHELFKGFDDEGSLIHVLSGTGFQMQQANKQSGMECELLLTSPGQLPGFQPYIVTLTAPVDNTSAIAYSGTQLIYMLEGSMIYRYGQRLVTLHTGDTIIFDASTPHGPISVEGTKARYFCTLLNTQILEAIRPERSQQKPLG